MMRTLQRTLAIVAAGLLLLGGAASAYHWDDEEENMKFMSHAGDENVQRDGGDCMNMTLDVDDEHCVVLYAHIFDLLNTVPINVQPPAVCAPNLARGFSGEVHTGDGSSKNSMELYSSPGFVEYTEDRCGRPGQEDPRLHPERGLSSDVRISQDIPIQGFWYLSADTGEFSPFGIGTGEDAEPSAGVMPCVSVRMQLWTERFPGTGRLIAEGTTTKTVVSTPEAAGDTSDLHGHVDEVCPGAEGTVDPQRVTEFRVDLEPAGEDMVIKAHEGYVIAVQWYQYDAGSPDEPPNYMQREWNMHTGSEFPNRIVMAVKDSIRIDQLRLVEFDNKVFILGSVNTPWGSYDVDTANIRMSIHDPDGNKVPTEQLKLERLDYSVDHDGHYKPVNATFMWDIHAETLELEPGEYTVRMQVTNWQHTEDAILERTFTLTEKGGVEVEDPEDVDPAEAPGPAAVLPLVVVLALLAGRALRRGRLH